jgi:RNA binding activity-knot of a chromodomain
MKKILTILFIVTLLSNQLPAQPSQTLVKNDFLKNGVTAVEGIVISKEWYKDHYLWKASFRSILPVKPEDVDGLKGVTMVRHVVAHYECGGSCSKTWSGLVYSEYKGINLPTPSTAELNVMLTKAAADDPSKFFRSMSGKYGITEIAVHPTEPKFEWINPKKLSFNAYKKNKEEVSYTEIALVETPLLVTLIRDGLKTPWRLEFASEVREKLVEISRSKKTDEANSNMVNSSDAGAEAKNKAEVEKLKVPTPPKFTTIEAAARDAYTMLFNLTREQYDYYLIMMMSPQMRCDNCKYTPNGNGAPKVNSILETAYNGNGTFRDQFCTTPKFTIEGNAAYFKNKRNDSGGDSWFMIDKAGDYYYINSAALRVTKDAAANAGLKAITCGTSTSSGSTTTTLSAGTWKVGDKVLVEENGKWFPSTVLQVRTNEWFIHYDGYASSYDLWVGPTRIKNK